MTAVTVRPVEPETLFTWAAMVVEPGATATAKPVEEMVATVVLELVHVAELVTFPVLTSV
jgi:hypothetical protein